MLLLIKKYSQVLADVSWHWSDGVNNNFDHYYYITKHVNQVFWLKALNSYLLNGVFIVYSEHLLFIA